MGMPAAPAYMIVAALAIPSLIELGVPVLAAHLFAFYFAVLSNVTPPVAMAAYAGASVARAPMMLTGVLSSRVAATGFLVPFLFVYGPALLLKAAPLEIAWAALTAVLGVICLAAALEGWLLGRAAWYERVLLIATAIALIKPGVATDGFGLAGCAVAVSMQWLRYGRRPGRH
jgi:TRAP-type uncharacterized transport system fused permease subunit